ncbi:MAG TPA: transcription termination factor NusA [Bacteroidales bacterium]|nr:transcription termination factor NusA [Bacteroidales bacterium]HOH22460.1 transcription termination factor NusA [Bacteroidales bacterium]HPB56945.1 transcription termination factor NusA [Bacteroidales bacterium]HPZ03550.1 transcription termination factor NusA [Bacteroidales bacterium]HQB74992.1 transcription termination factor NusA [Bacteroidales bacterium]
MKRSKSKSDAGIDQANENRLNLLMTFQEFKEVKSIDRTSMMRILEDVIQASLAKRYGPEARFSIIVNVDNGDLMIQRIREVIADGEMENEATQIELKDAIKIEADLEEGEECYETIHLSDFARREILTLRQNLINKILEYEKDNIFRKYEDKVGELVSGEVNQVWRKEILILDEDGVELILPASEQIPADRYKKGDTLVAVVQGVDVKKSTPVITISRTAPQFLERLMETEIPEIFDGLITIKNVVRVPGERAKVMVEAYDDRIDPVGACVGMKGSRIHSIVRELRNENIDIINYTENTSLLIARALNPAKITSIEIDEEFKNAKVYMKPDQVSLAIGKGGNNIRLASRLTGYEIDVYRDDEEYDEEDVNLDEFNDEFDQWVIDAFKAIGCDTAKGVLKLSREDLIQRTDLEEETVDEMIASIKKELDIE